MRDTHINYLNLLTRPRYHHVAGLDVLVDDLVLVEVVDAADELAANTLDHLDCEAVLIVFDEAVHVAAVAVLDDEVGLVLLLVGVVLAHEVFVLDDIFMVKLDAYLKFLELLLNILNCLVLVTHILSDFVHKVTIKTLNSDPGHSPLLPLAQVLFIVDF